MMTRITASVRTSSVSILRLALLAALVAVVPIFAVSNDSDKEAAARLVQIVRDATGPFQDVNAATAIGYGPFMGCVSGPDHGAMGIHYVNGGLVGDGEIDATTPEALIYEPSGDRLRLVGVEFIVDAATYLANHNNTPPVLEGQVFNLVNSPNRYNLPA